MTTLWNTNSAVIKRTDRNEALTFLNQIRALPENGTTVLATPGVIQKNSDDLPNIKRTHLYQGGHLKPSGLFEKVGRAISRSTVEQKASQLTWHQILEDIKTGFPEREDVSNDFQKLFFSKLQSGAPPTKGPLVKFLEKHRLTDALDEFSSSPPSETAVYTIIHLPVTHAMNEENHVVTSPLATSHSVQATQVIALPSNPNGTK